MDCFSGLTGKIETGNKIRAINITSKIEESSFGYYTNSVWAEGVRKWGASDTLETLCYRHPCKAVGKNCVSP